MFAFSTSRSDHSKGTGSKKTLHRKLLVMAINDTKKGAEDLLRLRWDLINICHTLLVLE